MICSIYTSMAEISLQMDNKEKAEYFGVQVVGIRDGWAKQTPTLETMVKLAMAHQSLGNIYRGTGKYASAKDCYNAGITIIQWCANQTGEKELQILKELKLALTNFPDENTKKKKSFLSRLFHR